MPLVRLVPVHEDDDEEQEQEEEKKDSKTPADDDPVVEEGALPTQQHSYPCPLFQNSERSGEENFIMELGLPSEKDPEVWALSGVALLCQEPKDR